MTSQPRNNLGDLVDEELERSLGQLNYGEDDHLFQPLVLNGELTPAELAEVINRLETIAAAARLATKGYKTLLAETLQAEGADSVRVGNRIFRNRPNVTHNLMPEMASRFVEYAGEDLLRLVNLKRAVRTGELKKVAKERGDDPQTVMDTFIESVEDQESITALPLDRAPMFLQALPEGGWR